MQSIFRQATKQATPTCLLVYCLTNRSIEFCQYHSTERRKFLERCKPGYVHLVPRPRPDNHRQPVLVSTCFRPGPAHSAESSVLCQSDTPGSCRPVREHHLLFHL